MVTESGYAVSQNQEGESFVVLTLEGDMEMIQSKNTGRFYATAKKCTISTTFSEKMAAVQVGKQRPGSLKSNNGAFKCKKSDFGPTIYYSFTLFYEKVCEAICTFVHCVIDVLGILFQRKLYISK